MNGSPWTKTELTLWDALSHSREMANSRSRGNDMLTTTSPLALAFLALLRFITLIRCIRHSSLNEREDCSLLVLRASREACMPQLVPEERQDVPSLRESFAVKMT